MKTSLIIPSYNEQESLHILYDGLVSISTEMNTYAFEYLFINADSTGNTLDTLLKLSSQNSRVRYISFSRNLRKEATMYAGVCNADDNHTVVIDTDIVIMVFFIMMRRLMFGSPVSDCPSLACIIMFMGGIQLFYMELISKGVC